MNDAQMNQFFQNRGRIIINNVSMDDVEFIPEEVSDIPETNPFGEPRANRMQVERFNSLCSRKGIEVKLDPTRLDGVELEGLENFLCSFPYASRSLTFADFKRIKANGYQ